MNEPQAQELIDLFRILVFIAGVAVLMIPIRANAKGETPGVTALSSILIFGMVVSLFLGIVGNAIIGFLQFLGVLQ